MTRGNLRKLDYLVLLCKRELGIPNEVKIEISFESMIDENGEFMGEGYERQINQTSYVIGIHDKLSKKMIIETIKHEMKHVQQRYNGRLRSGVNGYEWEGHLIGWKESYYDDEWEIEARHFEKTPIDFSL